jgi:hypothetical protein
MNNEKLNKRRKVSKWLLWLSPVIALSPLIIGGIGASLTPNCNESNCTWGVIPWYTIYTMPLGIAALIIGTAIKPNTPPTPEPLSDENQFLRKP